MKRTKFLPLKSTNDAVIAISPVQIVCVTLTIIMMVLMFYYIQVYLSMSKQIMEDVISDSINISYAERYESHFHNDSVDLQGKSNVTEYVDLEIERFKREFRYDVAGACTCLSFTTDCSSVMMLNEQIIINESMNTLFYDCLSNEKKHGNDRISLYVYSS